MATSSALECRSDPPDLQQVSTVMEEEEEEEEANQSTGEIMAVIDTFKHEVSANRIVTIKRKMEENKQKMVNITSQICNLSNSRGQFGDRNVDMLMNRQQDAVCLLSGCEEDNNGCEDDSRGALSAAFLSGSCSVVKNVVRPIKLSEVQKLPPYTTWIFLDRNQRMTDDQSVLGRRRIYYDQNGGEALICSDSEEEVAEDEEENKQFGNIEEYILRKTIQEVGLSDAVLDSLAQCFSRRPCDVKARYEVLLKGEKSSNCPKRGDFGDGPRIDDVLLDKDLDAALDSFDNLFCRRCLVFDCRLHGCSQDLVFPAEKQHRRSVFDEEKVPCSSHCYRLAPESENAATLSAQEKSVTSSGSAGGQISPRKKVSCSSAGRRPKSNQSESASSNCRNMSESSESEIQPRYKSSSPTKTKLVGRCGIRKRNSKQVAERVLVCMRKRQKKMAFDFDTKRRSSSGKDNEDASSTSLQKVKSPSWRKESPFDFDNEPFDDIIKEPHMTCSDNTSKKEELVDESICTHEGVKSWKALEKSLFAKGIEIFGRSSCLIARNLLNGMRTCSEIFQFMGSTDTGDGKNSLVDAHSKADHNDLSSEPRTRSRFVRRRGRVRRLKYTWKSAGYHSIRKRITEKKDQPCRQFNPCGCETACGKQCSCLVNGTCCEKYCGCPKTCKNRFRGCHCAKSQCRSRQCPCFAADRECDPDVCRNCWISCGDGTLGVPSQGGDNYECRNMKLLLKQQQRVLLGRSNVSGWGAFLKNSVNKHEYLGEYTGELISHREADKRGKIYDRENSSFLFNLNDQFVLDAYRKGDKLKFANHSPDPNCYAKVMMVAGDHRVGIFAKERISGGEELFYDYRYEPDRAPAWARKPESSGSKREDLPPSSGRAKKLA